MFNLFGGKKKKQGFYLELDENQQNKSEAPPSEEAVAASTTAAEPDTATAPAKAVAEKKADAPKAKTTKKTSIKKAKKSKAVKEKAPAPQPVAAAVSTAPETKQEAPIGNFATDYLVVQTLSRRRPGPSLNPFKEMASQVKTPQR